jgi:hypothetical protein
MSLGFGQILWLKELNDGIRDMECTKYVWGRLPMKVLR